MKNIKRKGFSLLEITLVLGVAVVMSFIKFQDLRRDQDNLAADAVGQQIKQVGEAVNGYISIHYDKIATLTTVSTGTGSDPGPRTCTASTSSCTITYQTLINDGLLPSSFNGMNANKSGYSIVLRRDGTSPNYVINGLVSTSNAWIEGGVVRYDLLGKAMSSAGIDSGMSKSASSMSGFSGAWTETATNFSNINKTGLLGYRTGYNSALYSVYLRRDGTLPMTGDLDMGGNDIKNAQNITASGKGTFGSSVAANGKAISDINTLFTSEGAIVGANVQAVGTVAVGTSSALKAYMNSQGDVYASHDVTALGTIYTKDSSNNIKSYMNSSGTVYAGAEVIAHNGYGDTITMGGDASGGSAADYEIRLGSAKQLTIYSPNATQYSTVMNVNRNMVVNERLSTNGRDPNNLPSGWGGGVRTYDVYASGTVGVGDESGNLKAYMTNSGTIYSSSNIQSAGTMTSSGRLTAGEFIQINGVATVNGACSSNGAVARDANGSLLSCVSSVWVKAGYTYTTYSASFSSATAGSGSQYQTTTMGAHLFCYISGQQTNDSLTKHVVIYRSGTSWILEQRVTQWPAGINTWVYAICAD